MVQHHINEVASLLKRFEQTGRYYDLQDAISKSEEAIAAIHNNHPDRPRILSILAIAYMRKFEQTDDLDNLQKAIRKHEEAFTTTAPHNYLARASISCNLVTSLRMRFKRTGNLDDLQKAISKGEEAIATTPHDYQDRIIILNSLALCFTSRFERVGDLGDLQKAISRGEEAMAATPQDCPKRAGRLTNLAIPFKKRFERTRDLDDLQQAIIKCEEALAATPRDHPNQASILSNLALFFFFGNKFQQTGNLEDLDIAISKGEEAVAATPNNHPTRARTLINLAFSSTTRFNRTRDLDDLEMAISKGEEAIAITPNDHPNRVSRLSELASSLQRRFEQTGDLGDSEQAVSLWITALNLHNAPPKHRIRAALYAAKLLIKDQKWKEASHITETAVKLLPHLSPRALKQNDQQHMLGEFSGLATLTASVALQAKKGASHALELLELGRGIIASLRFETRTDITKLRKQHPEMAEEFERLRDILDSQSPSTLNLAPSESALTPVSESNRRHDASLELEKIIDDIRHQPNFENFLLPPREVELKVAASSGPVVVINVSSIRCDAFLVETDAVRVLHLPLLSLSYVEENVKLMRSIRHPSILPRQARDKMSHILEWLWLAVAGPILDALRFRDPPSNDKWPRIWWIPTGMLNLLPLHAAGRQFPMMQSESVLDRVISSYSPSIKALLYSRRKSKQKELNFNVDKVLLASMRTTPGCSSLAFAEQEIEEVDSLLASTLKVKLEQPCKEAIISGLSDCTVFHFAGHGKSDRLDPSKNFLLLNDWQESPLTVEDLIGLELYQKPPWLAYLSACSTGESQVEDLHDEAIHLVAACQLAGFRHVVGSLWEISDKHSVDAAIEVYKAIRDGSGSDETVSKGVHNAIRLLRGKTGGLGGGPRSTLATAGEGDEEIDVVPPSDAWGEGKGVNQSRHGALVGHKILEESGTGNPLVWAAYIHVGL